MDFIRTLQKSRFWWVKVRLTQKLSWALQGLSMAFQKFVGWSTGCCLTGSRAQSMFPTTYNKEYTIIPIV